MSKLLITCSAALVAAASALQGRVLDVAGNLGTDHVVNVKFEALEDASVRELLDSFEDSIDEFGSSEVGVDFRVTEEVIEALENASVAFDDNTQTWVDTMTANLNDPSFLCTGENCSTSKDGADVFFDSYQSLTSLMNRVDLIAANSLATVGSIGTSYEGRTLKKIEIIKGSSNKPWVMYFCGIHAREWLPPMACIYMAETLVSNGGHPLLDSVNFAILPMMNPDGYLYSTTVDNLWRKTRKPNPFSSCVGTDLNRNYDDHHCGSGASTNPCSQTYCGPTPFDQDETRSLKEYAESIYINGGTILHAVDVHAYGYYWMSPYGWTTSLPPSRDYDRMDTCMRAAADAFRSVAGNSLTTGSSANAIYVASGGSDDWFYSALDVVFSYTAEVRGNSFQPAASNIVPSNLEVFAAMVANTECALADGNIGGGGDPDCFDQDPNGITYSNGQPAPCNEIGIYCSSYDFVRERCPATCGTCSSFAGVKIPADELSQEQVPALSESSFGDGTMPFVIGSVGVGLVAGVAAAAVVVRRKRKAANKVESVTPVKLSSASFAEETTFEVGDKPSKATKNPMISMYDV
mmetsp:Transcript_17331/g.19726  ORF Transcript_17331/g.19726 Transcript_17331/m.19726 type:complete len:577 (-) Transcript_17331:239-1969(-)